jgi:hypothetical protein
MRAVTTRRTTALLAAAVCATTPLAHAECPEGTPQAACVLHEEGVAALTARRYDEAATKFRGAISASPSARSYLGYSQAVEGQGKLALAYETMLIAQRLSSEELAGAGAKDPVKIGRAERIKYKISELGGRVGFVRLRLPEGVPPQRLVSVRREGEGDLPSPIGRWITVAPDQQVLIASLDNGTQVHVVAKVAGGSQSSLVLPIPVQRQSPQDQPPQDQPPQDQPPGQDRPTSTLYQRPAGPPPLPTTALTAGMTILSSGPELLAGILGVEVGAGIGVFGLVEQRVSRSLGLTFRADYVWHPTGDPDAQFTASGAELMALAGLRTMTRTLHARLEAGATVSSVASELFFALDPGTTRSSRTDVYPVLGVGAGLQLGRVRFHASLLYAFNSDPDELPDPTDFDRLIPKMPLRFMGVVGIDLWRR